MRTILTLLGVMALAPLVSAQGTAIDYARAAAFPERVRNKVLRDTVEPNWLPDGERFWYSVNLAGGKKEFVLVDAGKGTRTVVPEDQIPKPGKTPAVLQRRRPPISGNDSPDGRWTAFLEKDNVWIRDRTTQEEFRLSKEGIPSDAYTGQFFWSPDSRRLVAIRRTRGGDRQVTLVESSPKDQLQPKTSTYFYLKPGDEIPQPRPHLFDVANLREIPIPQDLFPNPWDISYEHWSRDSKRFYFFYNERGHRTVRVIAIDANTGAATAIVNEECKTFFDYAGKLYLQYFDEQNELVWMSERSGWNHLYRIDMTTGQVKNPITQGNWVVRGVERIENGEVWFRALGIDPKQDPYHVHYARVKLDGSGLVRLTDGDGSHNIRYSPNRKYYLDTYSRVDMPPVTELRKTADGSKILTVEKGDWAPLLETGWKAPERFVAKGRDGTTDIHGFIVRPTNFDPAKKYPVIEDIYAGPHDHHVPKTFRPSFRTMNAMAELGFIVVKIDGMGTNWRSKAFHDVCWKNLGDSGFPDRIAWIKAAAKKHLEMDLSRGVGIYGGSAGGQSSTRALLAFGDFYTVAVSDCGCHDNRVDKIWWNELWMSWPIGPHYAEQSNVTQAKHLKGKLLLVVGEMDRNVDPSSTLQVANALIQADRDFELLLIPGAGHGAAESPYGSRRRMDFFVRHLLKVEPRR